MEETFVYEDGSIDTPKEEIIALDAVLQDLEAKPGEIHTINGLSCLCISGVVNYGGGSRRLWAVEGHSAQLTYLAPSRIDEKTKEIIRSPSRYIKGKCIMVSKDPAGVRFQPNENSYWMSEEAETYGSRSDHQDSRFLSLNLIVRYDYGWY